jgi:hypothetical protein
MVEEIIAVMRAAGNVPGAGYPSTDSSLIC